MLKIKMNVGFDKCSCKVYSKDVTNFIDVKEGGFLRETDEYEYSGDYKMSDGVFLNLVFLKKFDDSIEILNTPYPMTILTEDVESVFENNFEDYSFKLVKDGNINIARIFIVSKEAYERLGFEEGDYVYYDRDKFEYVYSLEGNIKHTKDVCELLYVLDIEVTEGIYWNNKSIFSTCILKDCYTKLLHANLDSFLGDNPIKGKFNYCVTDTLIRDIEILKNILTAIKYLTECDNFTEASRILETVSSCSNICTNKSTKNGCGC